MRRPRGDEGSSVVDVSLVSLLVVSLFLVVLQVGVVLHTRTVLVAAAAEGARVGANADRTAADGVERTRALIADALSQGAADAMTVSTGPTSSPEGLPVVEVVVEGPLPVVFLPVGPLRITVRGHALEEAG